MTFTINYIQLDDAVMRMFELFSRCECALKRAGYLTNRNEGAHAEANWERWFSDLGSDFFTNVCRSKEARELVMRPPKRQIVKRGRLGWSDPLPMTNGHDLALAVRCVRNNLFHGGKYPGVLEGELSRDLDLVGAVIFVLETALKRSSEPIQQAFHSAGTEG